MKNIDFIKMVFSQMTADEMIDFCGGDSCVNVLCKLVDRKCFKVDGEVCCNECLRTFLSAEHKKEAEETDRISELQRKRNEVNTTN
jgi:uncharacterized Zn finger protein (UPF0148 family)